MRKLLKSFWIYLLVLLCISVILCFAYWKFNQSGISQVQRNHMELVEYRNETYKNQAKILNEYINKWNDDANYLYVFHDPKDELSCGYKDKNNTIIISLSRWYNWCHNEVIFGYGMVSSFSGGDITIDISWKESKLYKYYPFDNWPDYSSDGLIRINSYDSVWSWWILISGYVGYADVLYGSIVIEPKFKCASPFSGGVAKVSYECEPVPVGNCILWVDDDCHYTMKSDNRLYVDKKWNIIR